MKQVNCIVTKILEGKKNFTEDYSYHVNFGLAESKIAGFMPGKLVCLEGLLKYKNQQHHLNVCAVDTGENCVLYEESIWSADGKIFCHNMICKMLQHGLEKQCFCCLTWELYFKDTCIN